MSDQQVPEKGFNSCDIPQLARLSKSLVAIAVHREWLSPEHKAAVATGFVVDVAGEWVWVTAEHVLSDLEKLVVEFPETRVFWRAAADETVDATPFDFDPERSISLPYLAKLRPKSVETNEEDHTTAQFLIDADAGILSLSPLVCRNLEAVGVIPLTESDLLNDGEPVAKGLTEGTLSTWVGGFPRHLLERDEDGHLIQMPYAWLPIAPLKVEAPKWSFAPAWPEGSFGQSVEGMSGGPVAFVGTDEAYWFGIQSSQFRSGDKINRLIAADGTVLFGIIKDIVRLIQERKAQSEKETIPHAEARHSSGTKAEGSEKEGLTENP